MRLFIIISCIFLLCTNPSHAQKIELIKDYAAGATESVIGKLYKFDNSVIYNGKTPAGEKAIIRYDRAQKKIVTVLVKENVEGSESRFANIDDRLFVFGREGRHTKQIFEATDVDLSDLQLIYEVDNGFIGKFQIYNDEFAIVETDTLYKTNIKVIDSEGKVEILGTKFKFLYNEYSVEKFNGHYILVARNEKILDYNFLAFNLEKNTIASGSSVLPVFKKHKKLRRLDKLTGSDESILFDTDSTHIYNLKLDKTYSLPLGNWKLIRENKKEIFIKNSNDIVKINKGNSQQSEVVPNLYNYLQSNNYIIGLDVDSTFLRICVHNLDQDETYTQTTQLKSNEKYKLTDIAIVSAGVHVSIRYGKEPKSRLYRVNPNEIKLIDTLPMINSFGRIIACGEDIYITYKHPDFGSELFHIDYP